jgi:hypothetical protein
VTGNGTAEAYTTSMWGMGMSHVSVPTLNVT